ncbi:hypothetical protein RDI58_007444 [Solanum bulbocastanum]|uniref:Uncharacterized protein n=1 Tax=Solanum bulbocastanum TaxID=147425 RepID=A0AAN8YJ84_SOLBU
MENETKNGKQKI